MMRGFRDYDAEDRGEGHKRRYVCEKCRLIILRRDNLKDEGGRVLCLKCWEREQRECQLA